MREVKYFKRKIPKRCCADISFREQPIDYGDLEDSIRKTCLKLGLEDVDGFVTKCIQLYETTVVRHGLMLVGPTGSGKTRVSCCLLHKGDVTRDDSQRRFFAQHSVATLLRHYFEWLQHCFSIAKLCCVKNRHCESSRVKSP